MTNANIQIVRNLNRPVTHSLDTVRSPEAVPALDALSFDVERNWSENRFLRRTKQDGICYEPLNEIEVEVILDDLGEEYVSEDVTGRCANARYFLLKELHNANAVLDVTYIQDPVSGDSVAPQSFSDIARELQNRNVHWWGDMVIYVSRSAVVFNWNTSWEDVEAACRNALNL